MNAEQIASMKEDLERLHVEVFEAERSAELAASAWPTFRISFEDFYERLRSVRAAVYAMKESVKPDS